ncbi:tetratricopeptide repeat protein [Amycolatopsis sp. NPDC089917]
MLYHLGRRETAEREQRSTLELCERILGTRHPITNGCRLSLQTIRGPVEG